MSGRVVLIGAGMVAAVIVGAWLAGLFGGSAGDVLDPGMREQAREPAETGGQDPDPGPETTTRAIEAAPFEGRGPTGEGGGRRDPVASPAGGFQLTGRVLSPDGPVFGATVDLLEDRVRMRGVHQLGSVHESVSTDAEGRFVFEGLVPGERMILRVTHEEYTMGRVTGIDAARPSTLHQVIHVGTGHRVSGRVSHRDGRPLEGVRVGAYDLQIQAYEPEDQLERAARTGPDGTYELGGLRKGIKRLVASKPGLATEVIQTVQVPGQGEARDFVMKEGFSVEGTVVEQNTGQPVEGVRVAVRPLTGVVGPGRVESAFTEKDGSFVVFGLPEGRCELWAGLSRRHLQSQRQTVPAGSSGVVIEVPPAARLSGQVVDEASGRPVTSYTLLVAANPEMIIAASNAHRLKVDDPAGRFVFEGVPPMPKLHLVVRAPGHAETVFGPMAVSQGDRIDDIVIGLGRGAVITGRVLDDAGGPISGAEVEARRSFAAPGDPQAVFLAPLMQAHARTVSARTDEDGRYTIVGLREGTWEVRVDHDRFATARKHRVSLAPDDERELPPITLSLAGTVRGVVRTKEGGPDSAARLTLTSANDPTLTFKASTDPRGRFEVTGVPPGDYKVSVVQREGVVSLADLLPGAVGNPPKVHTVLAGKMLELDL